MRTGSILFVAVVISLVTLPLSAADPPADPIDPALAANVNALLRQLDSDDYRTRDAASTAIEALPGEALPLIEAAMSTGELSPEVSLRLDAKISLLRRKAVATAYEKRIRHELDWSRDTALSAYDHGGHTNPKWDAAAHEAIVLNVRPRFDPNRSPRDDARIDAAFRKAVDLGCDDPLVLYLQANRYRQSAGSDPQVAYERTNGAGSAIMAGNYPPFRKLMAATRVAETLLGVEPLPLSISTKRRLTTLLDYALAQMPAAAREGTPPPLLYEAAATLHPCYAVLLDDPEAALHRVESALRAAAPRSSVPDLLLADFYINRGEAVTYDSDPPSRRVPAQDKPKVLQDLNAKAAAAVDAALAVDPDDPPALGCKLRLLTRLQVSQEEFDPWYQKAMTAYPNNYLAARVKRIFLRRLTGQDDGPPMEFARECLQGGNWGSRIPLVVLEAHQSRATALGEDAEVYYSRPDVWADVQAAEEGYLKRYPKAVLDRTHYALLACYAGQWDVAKRQFDQLGEDGVYTVFRGKQTYDYYRRKASRLSAAAAAPAPPAQP